MKEIREMRYEDIEKLSKELNANIRYIESACDGHCVIVDIEPISELLEEEE